jgi:HTH-type transcriptional regulator/antitoxin HigA
MTITPAEVFPPGEYLRDELEAREWTVTEFADIIGRPLQAVSEILNNRKEITPETAAELAAALGTSPEFWLNLQNAYQLHQLRSRGDLTEVQRRARLRSLVPLAELRKLRWLPDTDDLGQLEAAVCKLLEIKTLDETPRLTAAARRSNSDAPLMPSQTAWLHRAAAVARRVRVGEFDRKGFAVLASDLAHRLVQAERLADVRHWLADVGVAFVAVPHLRGSKIDGAAFQLDAANPAIALSLRGNRFDGAVFTLAHEMAHVLLGHIKQGATIDEDLTAPHGGNGIEAAADDQANSWLFPHGLSVSPPISKTKVLDTAHALQLHPALVVGQLQWQRQDWSLLRNMIPPARDLLTFD